jgi:bile acid-coenzyme A ligase
MRRAAFSESVNHVLGVLVTVPGGATSIVGRIRHLAVTRGEDLVYRHVAVDGAERAVSWGWLDQRSSQLAGALRGRGVGFGDRIGLGLRNSPELVLGVFAAWKLGAVPVPVRWDVPE